MSRLESSVKVLHNFCRDLDGKEQAQWNSLVEDYVETEARHITHYLKSKEVGLRASSPHPVTQLTDPSLYPTNVVKRHFAQFRPSFEQSKIKVRGQYYFCSDIDAPVS
jgi:hypothetical protein